MTVPIFAGASAGGLPYGSLRFDSSNEALDISAANFGVYNRSQSAFVFGFYFDSAAGRVVSSVGNTAQPPREDAEWRFSINSTGNLTVAFYHADTDPVLVSQLRQNSIISAGQWYSCLVYFDTNNATTADQIRLWVNGTEYPSASASAYTAPQGADIFNSGQAVRVGGENRGSNSNPFGQGSGDNLIYQHSVISGNLPTPAQVFNGTSGGLTDISKITGCHSHLGAETSAVEDTILAANWTQNDAGNPVTVSELVP